jgi:Fe2+ transport system protein FeoA
MRMGRDSVKRAGGGAACADPPAGDIENGPRITRLRDLRPGEAAVIHRLSCRRQLRRRLMDMGVVAGTPVEIERVAPLGDPIELKLKGFHLSLRKEEAGDIWVEVRGDEC